MEIRVTPNPIDKVCEGHDPVKATTDCISSFIMRGKMYLSSAGMLYSDQVEPPKCSSDKSSSKEIEENELHLAAGPVDLTHVMFWPGKLWKFDWKGLILYVQENDSVEQVSKAAKSDQPKSITACIHFHITYTPPDIWTKLPVRFYSTRANARRGTGKTEGRVPSWVDSCDSSICGYKPGHYPIPENMENNRHQSQSQILEEVLVNCETKPQTWHKSFSAHGHLSLFVLMLNRYPAVCV